MAKNPLELMNAVANLVGAPKEKKKKAVMAKKGDMKDDSAIDGQPEPDADDAPAQMKSKGKAPAKPNF